MVAKATVSRELKSPVGRLVPHEALLPIYAITTVNVRFIVVQLTETVNLPANDTGQWLYPSHEIEELLSEAFKACHCGKTRQISY